MRKKQTFVPGSPDIIITDVAGFDEGKSEQLAIDSPDPANQGIPDILKNRTLTFEKPG